MGFSVILMATSRGYQLLSDSERRVKNHYRNIRMNWPLAPSVSCKKATSRQPAAVQNVCLCLDLDQYNMLCFNFLI